MRFTIAISVCLFALSACAHDGPTSDQRLDQDTRGLQVEKAIRRSDLVKINCRDVQDDLKECRNTTRSETERMKSYIALYRSLEKRANTFEVAMARNPDLAYDEGNEPLVAAKDQCVQATADVKLELEKYVRDIIRFPTVREVKGGATRTVPRLDFDVVREAIRVLNLDDKAQLNNRLDDAQRQVDKDSPSGRRHH